MPYIKNRHIYAIAQKDNFIHNTFTAKFLVHWPYFWFPCLATRDALLPDRETKNTAFRLNIFAVKVLWIKLSFWAIAHMCQVFLNYRIIDLPLSNSAFFYLSNYRFIDYRSCFFEKIIDSSISIHEIYLSIYRLSI